MKLFINKKNLALIMVIKIKSFEDACEVLSVDQGLSRSAFEKLEIVTSALNDGWVANQNDPMQAKFFPFINKAAIQERTGDLKLTGDLSLILSGAGSLSLSFKSPELALYASSQFESLYLDMILE
ncbi:hypothetical protein LZD49_07155 [Dyadobacter sp. CY261]|uniref:hypothetical protein n=1 Tax=Dyadobacter sp. CY261 TaxID=2907203 RepID=UPI001F250FD4|nr:hypothetical protein [Dyadobacter sp. CY261]MCF0070244.1 hypothetical protein [Dyadobacter sp. CY261]